MTEKIRQEGPKGLFIAGGFASPRAFFEEVVSPNVDNFLQDHGNRQIAFNAAVGLYHMVDYVCEFAAEHQLTWFPDIGLAGIKRYRERLIAICPEFGIAEAVALVYKHFRIGNARAKHIASTIVSVQRRVEILGSNEDISSYPDGMRFTLSIDFTKPYRARESLVVVDASGKEHVLHQVFAVVRDMWRQEIDRIGMDAITPSDLHKADGDSENANCIFTINTKT